MRLLLAVLVWASACTARAQGTSEAILGYTNAIPDLLTGTAGWVFRPATNITITQLGCLADFFPNNATTNLLQVGLWGPNSNLLASASITPDSTAFHDSLYAAVTPTTLTAGQLYSVGVYFPSGLYSLDLVAPGAGGTVTPSLDILSYGAGQNTNGYAQPTFIVGGDSAAFLGPNFRYTGGVPEPSLGVLLALGGGLLFWRRRGRAG